MSRIKWEIARRIIGRYYLVQPNNWPHRFAPEHLAHLQYPQDGKNNKSADACQDAIEYACGIGELPFTVESFKFPPSAAAFDSIMDTPESEIADKWLAECSMQELPAISADDFKQWLTRWREVPSEHIAAWFDARCTAPATTTMPAPETHPVTTEQETPGSKPSWNLKKPKRFQCYARPLYELLREFHIGGKPKPTAHDVLEAFSKANHPEIASVIIGVELNYYTAGGTTIKTANLKAIGEAIRKMTL